MREPELFLLFVRPLNRAGIRYVVTGSVAAIFYGEPRLTHDVDFVILLNPSDIEALAKLFPAGHFYLPPPEILAAEAHREQRGHFNIIHKETGFKADMYLTGRDELNAWALKLRRSVQLGSDTVVFAPAEYVILRKLEYYREGGSDKHLRDIRSILAISGGQLDRAAIHEWIHRRGLQAEWLLVSGQAEPGTA